MESRMMSECPVFDDESISLIFRYFRESLFKIWECYISIWHDIHNRKDYFGYLSETKKLLIYLSTSANIGSLDGLSTEILIELIYRVKYYESWKVIFPSRQYDILSSWEYAPYGLECLTAHDDRVSECRRLKVSKILSTVPWDIASTSYDAVLCHRGDSGIVESHRKSIFFSGEKAKFLF